MVISHIDAWQIGSHETIHKHPYPSQYQIVFSREAGDRLCQSERSTKRTAQCFLMSKDETMSLVTIVIAVMVLWLGLKPDWWGLRIEWLDKKHFNWELTRVTSTLARHGSVEIGR